VNLTRKTVVLYVCLVFASGIALGAISDRLYATMASRSSPSRSETYKQNFISRAQARLHLTDQQVAQLSAIMDQTRSQFRELQEKMAPELLAIQQQENAKIRDILSPEQNAEFDKVIQEQKEKQRAKKDRR
jgi:Spy/CpxP family protein refolding chaperone